jgi:hypothetical protein
MSPAEITSSLIAMPIMDGSGAGSQFQLKNQKVFKISCHIEFRGTYIKYLI